MKPPIEAVLAFQVSGKFAHFRKFYTNASSLSYIIPPRTAVIGLLASILKIPRDGYYDIFNPDECKISVAVAPGTVIKKSTRSVNMIHDSYFTFLLKGTGKVKGQHTQCKMELLSAPPGHNIGYNIYVAMAPDNHYFRQLRDAVESGSAGYGIYFGQRQFRASFEYTALYGPNETRFIPESDTLDSLCLQENASDIKTDDRVHLVVDQMPIHMRSVEQGKGKGRPTGREPVSVKRVLVERSGKRIYGRFRNCLALDDTI
ncbi:MAG: CRISPR-associated protein Cas5, partial [bacterium]|nr:CRISPR-associated protein Cas5 [bacterium]